MAKPRACHYCGKPVLVSKHNHDHRIEIGPNNQITSDRIWHLECNPFTIQIRVQPQDRLHSEQRKEESRSTPTDSPPPSAASTHPPPPPSEESR